MTNILTYPGIALRKLQTLVRLWLHLPPPLVKSELLGQTYTVRKGTLRAKADYDDAWLFTLAQDANTVIDIGANIGQAAFLILQSQSVKSIVLVEANPEALSLAADNLIRNQLSRRAIFICAFASERAENTVDFWTVGSGAAGSMFQGHAKTASKKEAHFKIHTVTIDDLCSELAIEPDLIKIDVEGAESRVLTGSGRIAEQQQTRFFVEMHSPPELPMAQNANLILDWCRQYSYTAWYLKDHAQLTSADQIAHRGRCHLLLQPATWPYPEKLKSIQQSAPISL